MPKTKIPKREHFNIEKDVLEGRAVGGAPIVGGEFVTTDGDWQGQTVQVQSDKHLEDDKGTGIPVIIRGFRFAADPAVWQRNPPTLQQIFDSHVKGIAALLWQDGLTPLNEVPPQIVIAKDKAEYIITVASTPQVGQTVLETPQTLSEIVHAGSQPNPK